jgi:hypothetical protein
MLMGQICIVSKHDGLLRALSRIGHKRPPDTQNCGDNLHRASSDSFRDWVHAAVFASFRSVVTAECPRLDNLLVGMTLGIRALVELR